MSTLTADQPVPMDDQAAYAACDKECDSLTLSKTSLLTLAKYAICILLIAGVVYYAYMQFTGNIEGYTKDLEPEKSDVASDFNLHNAIDELKKMQANILSTLSPAWWVFICNTLPTMWCITSFTPHAWHAQDIFFLLVDCYSWCIDDGVDSI